MLGIVTITYNIPVEVLLVQIACIKRFCKDPHEIVVIDNSHKQDCIDAIAYHVRQDPTIEYFKTKSTSQGSSDSHAFAANLSYSILKEKYAQLLYLDHDCMPVREFSVKEILTDKLFGGIGQEKQATYFWPGCFVLDNQNVDKEIVNFSPDNKLGLDTGGMTRLLIEKYGKDKGVFFDEQYVQNENFTGGKYNYYALIYKGTFLHFVNGSNWNHIPDQESRINSLVNLVKKILEDNS